MKLSLLLAAGYAGRVADRSWPVSPASCDPDVARRSVEDNLALGRRADEKGFDWVSVSEHHYGPIMLTPNPLVWAGALTQVVRRARIALLGPVLPLNNPVRVAEEVAMLDLMSGGRIIVLFLRGVPNETRTYLGGEPTDPRAATQEGIDLILKAWTAPEPFAWEGEQHRYGLVSIWPQPFQKPHPPVFGSGNSDDSVLFAAQRRLGLAISFAPVEQVARQVARYRAEAEKAGWSPTPDHVLYRAVAQVSESDAVSESHAGGEGIFRPFFHGGPKSVLGQIDSLRAAGVGVIDMAFAAVSHERAMASVDILAEAVLPQMREMEPA
ncbi:MAG TPA: LLM class flavin-dependent oxidoreductase [Caulobacteraceae bacterium]|nr:LLM class flavin-dependent oxidoreductase [Caulobacteraceae bacterium]